jgi:glycosyltransferase involved in cell wall biosynthesis
MICILHGYLLEGSGSNLWTRAIVEALCRQGETVHLVAQENHPEQYPFITEGRLYLPNGEVETWFRREGPHAGCCILHKPVLGDTLPVYVWDRYEEFPRVVPMVELSEAEIESYLDRNTRALLKIVQNNDITALHANHAVLMPTVAQRVRQATGLPFTVMPHGSALEYAVKRDPRFWRRAADALSAAGRIFVHGDEMRERVLSVFDDVPGLEVKMRELHLGVDTRQFEPAPQGERRDRIARLHESLKRVPRGRTTAQTEALRTRLHGGMDRADLEQVLAVARGYDTKAPDADLEAKLSAVNWGRDSTLLYVGRLISAKGVQDIVAAMPLLLEQNPELRLLIVGHGPLREPLEALLWALEHGARELAVQIIAWGQALEGEPEGDSGSEVLTKVAHFFDQLREHGELDAYFAAARRHLRSDRVIFTGYLTHRDLRHLFACCDVAVFPSVVKEAGPLVFLEALASGAFPMGTYFGGMKASIDAVAEALPPGAAEAMKLDPAPDRTVADIVRNVPIAVDLGERYKDTLYQVARERYDWASVARTLSTEMSAL